MKVIINISFLLLMTVKVNGQIKSSENMQSERFKTGWKKLQEIDGEAGEKVIESLKDISPDLGTYIIEYAFGDIYSRDGLDLKSKEIAVVAALTAIGNAQPQLKVHINGALNTESSINEVKEVILQMSVYSGFPSCINAMNALKEVLAERKKKTELKTKSEKQRPKTIKPTD
ncbi:carboxymuconolactone decarboxylase family protein [Olivibacter sitiensis]|uniref:carboxymuconolactone decarboxylase family protein n=1 Tax=Olivibacter sitiensis TaxID=376470 RepID=UPI000418C683|nr:carboxymuconolactone decarboxylase family protein [Olivibacter sitiensis]